MIPPEIINMQNGVLIGHVGTRNARLQGAEVLMWTITIDAPNDQITVFIPTNISDKTIDNVTDNKKISAVITDPLTHTSYQLKGDYASHHACNDEEHALIKKYVDKFYQGYLAMFGYPAEIVNTFKYMPATAITMKVNDIFNQTPGPNAGKKIN